VYNEAEGKSGRKIIKMARDPQVTRWPSILTTLTDGRGQSM